MTEQRLNISKLDAARRQLETAMLLYFREADPVAIHSLAAAAHEILKDLSSKVGSPMPIERTLVRALGKELAEKLGSLARKPQNFFKHADRNAESVLEFSPGLTDLILLDGVVQYCSITGEQPPMLGVFIAWFSIQHPEVLENTSAHESILRAHRELRSLTRTEFLSEFQRYAPAASSYAAAKDSNKLADVGTRCI